MRSQAKALSNADGRLTSFCTRSDRLLSGHLARILAILLLLAVRINTEGEMNMIAADALCRTCQQPIRNVTGQLPFCSQQCFVSFQEQGPATRRPMVSAAGSLFGYGQSTAGGRRPYIYGRAHGIHDCTQIPGSVESPLRSPAAGRTGLRR